MSAAQSRPAVEAAPGSKVREPADVQACAREYAEGRAARAAFDDRAQAPAGDYTPR